MKLQKLIQELEIIAKNPDSDNFVNLFEEKLSEIAELHDPSSIQALIRFLDDDFEYDELMFSIIHTIEIFDDDIYVQEIINSLHDFCLKSPRWASIVHMRILNSDSTLNAYIRKLDDATLEGKNDLKLLLNSINKKYPNLSEKTDKLLKFL